MRSIIAVSLISLAMASPIAAQRRTKTQKPPLHGSHWMAITGKPLGATAGSMIFQKGGNAVDAAAAMIAATCTLWDTLSWGGETQALIYNPHTRKVIGLNALGVAPTGATAEFYRAKNLKYPPDEGPLAAVTPGTPGGIMAMLAEYGTLSLKDVLAPAIELADGFPIEQELVNRIERTKASIKNWPYSRTVLLPNLKSVEAAAPGRLPAEAAGATPAQDRAAPTATGPVESAEAGEIFRQPDLAATLRKLVEAEQQALAAGKSRKEAIYAAYDRFYKGDIAAEISRGTLEQGGLITVADLAKWKPRWEEPVKTNYKGIDVYKLNVWTQGPAMLQALNILENIDLKSMGFNSPRYINTVYQAMSLAFADRDFYYGDIYTPPVEPVRGLLSKEYARERAKLITSDRNNTAIGPGDPYPYQSEKNPYADLLPKLSGAAIGAAVNFDSFYAGTTSVQAADKEGWVVSVTPSGGWVPAVIAGKSGVGLSQRAQSFVTDRAENPFNVIAPGKQPRVTLTPTLALKDGEPYLSFAVQGGDSQDQNLLQMFLDIVEFGMTVQQATEAPNFNSFQMRSSFGAHETVPGKILLNSSTPQEVRTQLQQMGFTATYEERTSGPINAIYFDRKHGTFWGGSSNHGEDYGVAW